MPAEQLDLTLEPLRHDETHSRQAQDRPEARREYLGPARRARSTSGSTARASMGSAAAASCLTMASSCAPSRSSRAITAISPRSSSRPSIARRRGSAATPAEKLIGLLERRLDAIVYRAKFVPTVFAARQFVCHGHVRVNGRRVNIPSYPLPRRRRGRGTRQGQGCRPGARGRAEPRAAGARLYRRRPQQDDGQADAHPDAL